MSIIHDNDMHNNTLYYYVEEPDVQMCSSSSPPPLLLHGKRTSRNLEALEICDADDLIYEWYAAWDLDDLVGIETGVDANGAFCCLLCKEVSGRLEDEFLCFSGQYFGAGSSDYEQGYPC